MSRLKQKLEPEFIIVHTDGFGNKQYIKIGENGELGTSYNQNRILSSVTNISYMLTPNDFYNNGYDNVGTKHQLQYMKDFSKKAYEESNGDPEKYSELFSKYMKTNIKVSEVLKEKEIVKSEDNEVLVRGLKLSEMTVWDLKNAYLNGNKDFTFEAIRAGFDVNSQTPDKGETILHYIGDDIELTKLCLEKGFDMYIQDGRYDMSIAQIHSTSSVNPDKHNDVIKMLVENGYDPKWKNSRGYDLFDAAGSGSNSDLLEYLYSLDKKEEVTLNKETIDNVEVKDTTKETNNPINFIDKDILKDLNTKPKTQKEKIEFMKAAEQNLEKMYERMIETGTYEEIKEFYRQMSKFNRYTMSNIHLAAFQGMLRGIEVSKLASYNQFKDMGASVKQGESALMIKKFEITYEIEEDKNGNPKKDKKGRYIYKKDEEGNKIENGHRFIPVPVFDVSQTNARELGLIKTLDYRNNQADISDELLSEVAQSMREQYGITITFEELGKDGLGGYYTPSTKSITVNNKNRTNGEQISTLFHEIGHFKLHSDLNYGDIHKNKGIIEGEAESVSYILSYSVGVENKSELYIAGWGNNVDEIKQSQKKILKASQEVSREINLDLLLEKDNQRLKEKSFKECSSIFVKLNNNEYSTVEDIKNITGKYFDKFIEEGEFNMKKALDFFYDNSSEESLTRSIVFDKLNDLNKLDPQSDTYDRDIDIIQTFLKNTVNQEFLDKVIQNDKADLQLAEKCLKNQDMDKVVENLKVVKVDNKPSLSQQMKELSNEVSDYNKEVDKFNKSYGDKSTSDKEEESNKRKNK